jgi:drug/metabolite transporter (DMT)-like permease
MQSAPAADGRHAAEIDSVLRDKGLKTFFDRRNLAAGLPWVRALEQAIGAAKAVIVLIGPRGLGNTQQYERELAFVRQSRDPAFTVVPLVATYPLVTLALSAVIFRAPRRDPILVTGVLLTVLGVATLIGL